LITIGVDRQYGGQEEEFSSPPTCRPAEGKKAIADDPPSLEPNILEKKSRLAPASPFMKHNSRVVAGAHSASRSKGERMDGADGV
jgi:hypothetical protein